MSSFYANKRSVLFLIGMVILVIIAKHFVFNATAESDALTQVRRSQSDIHNAAHKVTECLRDSVGIIEYIQAQAHENAVKMDFQME